MPPERSWERHTMERENSPAEFDNRPGRTPGCPLRNKPANAPAGGPSFAPGSSGAGSGGSSGGQCSRRTP